MLYGPPENESNLILQLMKKIFLAATILAAATLTGCGNKTNPAAEGAADSVANQVAAQSEADSLINAIGAGLEAKDPKSVEDAVAGVKARYDELVKAGLTEEAEAYAAKFKEFFDLHADEVKAVTAGSAAVSELVNTVTGLPSTAGEAVEKVKEDAEKVKENAEKAVSEGKEAVKKDLENKRHEAEEKTRQKAADAVNKAADKANKAVSGALNKALGGN